MPKTNKNMPPELPFDLESGDEGGLWFAYRNDWGWQLFEVSEEPKRYYNRPTDDGDVKVSVRQLSVQTGSVSGCWEINVRDLVPLTDLAREFAKIKPPKTDWDKVWI